jgi:GxxExxY protein
VKRAEEGRSRIFDGRGRAEGLEEEPPPENIEETAIWRRSEYEETAYRCEVVDGFDDCWQRIEFCEWIGMTLVEDPLVKDVIGCAIRVHRELGPGLLESTYGRCFRLELAYRTIRFANEVWLPIVYRETRLDRAYRVDLMVEDRLIIEIKAIEKILPVHLAQLHTYVRLSQATQGVLFNFSHPTLKEGIRSVLPGASVSSIPSDPSTVE